jgi:predicted O-linked N-acetylglucosamine transferase (SPINDLY family)
MLMAGMLEDHDRSRFEIYAYSSGPAEANAMRARIVSAVDHFVDLRDQPIRLAAQRIAQDDLDVLIDLGGYVRRSRMEILAYRPAPLQGHFLGYPGTTGAPCVDFYVGDGITIPAAYESAFSEKVLRMPDCYQPNDPRRVIPQPRARSDCGLPDDALVLCSFNQAVKIRQPVFERWCELLRALPGSRLWLLDAGAAIERLRSFAKARGIDPERLVFAPQVTPKEHLERLASADIAVDTFPYSSHTTASDALWSGVPLITRYGETFASRVAYSILTAAGCADWAFDNAGDAFDATLTMARDPRRREEARARVDRARHSSPLFDARKFARDFENLIEAEVRRR